MKAGEAMERFEKGMREERKALATRQTYTSHVRCFLRFVPGVECVTVEDRVTAYLSTLACRVGSPLDAGETNITPLRRMA